MTATPDWTWLIIDASRRYPHFPPATIERLVARTAREFERADDPRAAVRDAVLEQLRYIDEPDSLPPLQAPPSPACDGRTSRPRARLRGR